MAMFCGIELEEKYPRTAKCFEILFNKICEDSFPMKWNTTFIVSISKKKLTF